MAKYKTRENALRAKGEIYSHYKGGVYRKLLEAVDTTNGECVVVYEHLYPHEHNYFTRPKDEFEGEVKVSNNMVKRFAKVNTIIEE